MTKGCVQSNLTVTIIKEIIKHCEMEIYQVGPHFVSVEGTSLKGITKGSFEPACHTAKPFLWALPEKELF